MKLTKANVAGLISSQQQSELKSILAGAWPALKPLPVFKYQTAEYRASIDFDKKRGEWVCHKTSLASNKVQELRGELSAITMALPHGEAELSIDSAEELAPEFAKDASRRLQALQEWKEKHQNGARYFELRDYLSDRQRTELDDSLRLSLTARQLQFNPKNVANVFDDLAIAGGRFAALIEFAKRNQAKQGTAPQAQAQEAVVEVEPATEHHEQSLEVSSREFNNVLTEPVLNNNEPIVQDQKDEEHGVGADEFPVLSVKDVFPEPEEAPLAEQAVHSASQHLEAEPLEIGDADLASLVEPPMTTPAPSQAHREERRRAFAGFVAHARTIHSPADHAERSPSRFPVLEISALHLAAFAFLSLAAIAFAVGLAVGRGPLGKRVPEAPKPMVAVDAQPLAPRALASESAPRVAAPRVATPPVASSDGPASAGRLGDASPPEEKSKESRANSEFPTEAEVHSSGVGAHSASTPTTLKPALKPEVDSEHRGAAGFVARRSPPRASSKLAHARSVAARKSRPLPSPAPYTPTATTHTASHLPGPSTLLVSVPRRGSQPFKVSFPQKAVAATSSFAMSSQLSVVVPPEPGVTAADKSARLEAGELVSFGWPHYPSPGDRYGLAETIKVRATIGELGQVREVKFLDGSLSLLPATTQAIRQWRYMPTLLDKRPVQGQQDITIEFRPPQYASRLSTPHPSHN